MELQKVIVLQVIFLGISSSVAGYTPVLECTCEPVTPQICGARYNRTIFPNKVNKFSTARDALKEFRSFPIQSLSLQSCSSMLITFLCSYYFPPCVKDLDLDLNCEGIGPCDTLCKQVRAGCEPLLLEHNYTWPDHLNCSKFPTSKDAHCIPATPPITVAVESCEKVKQPICAALSSKYMTRFPNKNLMTQTEADIKFNTFVPALSSNCSSMLKMLLCTSHYPICTNGSIQIYPCRHMCEQVRQSCEPCLLQQNISWPKFLNCSNFPNKNDTNVCVDRDFIDADPHCIPATPPITAAMESCEKVKQPICAALSSKYMTRFPNKYFITQTEADIQFNTFVPALSSNCSSMLKMLLCTSHYPICTNGSIQIYPCRHMCEQVRQSCEPFLLQQNVSWPKFLNCSNFPNKNDTVCVDHDLIDADPHCIPATPPITVAVESCEKVKQPICAALNPKYTTQFPNKNFITQTEADIHFNPFVQALSSNCSSMLKMLLCTSHYPICTNGSIQIYPCRHMCEQVRQSCEPCLLQQNVSWPKFLNCSNFPNKNDTNVCVDRDFIDADPHCIPATPPITAAMESCEKVKQPICAALSSKYMTRFPNKYFITQTEADIQFNTFVPALSSNCSSMLKMLLCTSHYPICTNGSIQIYPCRHMCEQVRQSCEPFLLQQNVSWPKFLNCSNFPNKNDTVCVDHDLIDADPHCIPATPPITVAVESCEKVKQPICAALNPKYTTQFPNKNFITQTEADIHFNPFVQALSSNCSSMLKMLLCTSHYPICTNGSIQIYPCRHMCEQVRQSCEPFLLQQNVSWPKFLNCSNFPNKNNTKSCVDRESIFNAPITPIPVATLPPMPRQNVCEPILPEVLEICGGIHSNYTMTHFPYGQFTSQRQAIETLKNCTDYLAYLQLINGSCAAEIKPFLCLQYFPMCSPTQPITIVKPCRNVCRKATNGCSACVDKWPFDCDDYKVKGTCLGLDDLKQYTRKFPKETIVKC